MTWSQLKIGGGGQMVAMNFASDGSMLTRSDAYGLYGSDGTSPWQQLVTMQAMPSGDSNAGVNNQFGASAQGASVYASAFAPSNPSRIYKMLGGNVYRSDNKGVTWIKTTFTQVTTLDTNRYPTKIFTGKIAIDPANADVVYASAPLTGLFLSTDAGSTWSQVTAVGTGTNADGNGGGHATVFDLTSSVVGGRTQTIYVSTYGTGVYKSTDGGSTWTLQTGTPTTHTSTAVDQFGTYWHQDNSSGGGPGNLWRYIGTTWTQVYGSQSCKSFAVDPTAGTTAGTAHVYVMPNPGNLAISTDGAATFTPEGTHTRTATDVPWLANTNESFMTIGGLFFSPAGRLYFSEGIGNWYTDSPSVTSPSAWISRNAGIENMVTNQIIVPPGGTPVIAFWDRPVFNQPSLTTYPSNHGVNYTNEIQMGHIDYTSSDPRTIVCLANFGAPANADSSGISSDGGATWSLFPTMPADIVGSSLYGGCIAAASPTNIVICESDLGNAYYTTDGGASWTQITLPGVTSAGWGGAALGGFSYVINRNIVCADRVTPDTFYMYLNDIGGGGGEGLYISSNKGVTWTKQGVPGFNGPTGFAASLQSVPGQAGHLFFTAGVVQGSDHPQLPQSFFRSTDGGATWSALTNVQDVFAFGFGASAPGQTYPASYYWGWNSGTLGIWQSIDNAVSWTSISDGYPAGNYSGVKCLAGDPNKYGVVYVGTTGASVLTNASSAVTAPVIAFSVVHGRGGRHTKMIGY